MKKTLLIAFVAMLAATQAFAAAGSISIFSSSAAATCALQQPAVSTAAAYAIVHVGTDGATGSAFSAPIPPCAAGIIIVDVAQVPSYIGRLPDPAIPSQVGVSAGYGVGNCRTGPIHIADMIYKALTPIPGCCPWHVVANPALGVAGPVSYDCSVPIQQVNAGAGAGIISVNTGACSCSVDTKDSTWGAVKELFRQGI